MEHFLHGFGNPVTCAGCKQPTLAAWAPNAWLAAHDKGFCDTCFASGKRFESDEPAQTPPPAVPTGQNEEPGNGPIIER